MKDVNVLLMSIDEIWLKGLNRKRLIQTLRQTVTRRFRKYHDESFKFSTDSAKFIAESEKPFSSELIEAIKNTPGLHSVLPSVRADLDMDKILPIIIDNFSEQINLAKTFRIKTMRSNKDFPIGSQQISRTIGSQLLEAFSHIKVKMDKPDIQINIRVLQKNIYISTYAERAVGGLPVGTSGRALCLLSGGIDSPVASFMMATRGVDEDFVFFHAYPFVGDEVKEKILKIAWSMTRYLRKSNLYIVPFGDIQKKIADLCEPGYRTLFFRKYMIEAADLLAIKIRSDALVTGDSLGQVSSQTMGNLKLLDKCAKIPIFRPLIAFRKDAVVQLAKKINTFELSAIAHDDACSLFADKHPITYPDVEYFNDFSQKNSFTEEIQKCIEQAERIKLY